MWGFAGASSQKRRNEGHGCGTMRGMRGLYLSVQGQLGDDREAPNGSRRRPRCTIRPQRNECVPCLWAACWLANRCCAGGTCQVPHAVSAFACSSCPLHMQQTWPGVPSLGDSRSDRGRHRDGDDVRWLGGRRAVTSRQSLRTRRTGRRYRVGRVVQNRLAPACDWHRIGRSRLDKCASVPVAAGAAVATMQCNAFAGDAGVGGLQSMQGVVLSP